jgi:hypothetical protein
MPHGRVAGYERYSDAERAHRPCHQVWGASSDSQAAEDEEAVDGQGAGFAEVMSNITLAMWRAVCGWEDGRVRGWTGPLSKSFRVCAYISRIKRYLDTIRYDTIRYYRRRDPLCVCSMWLVWASCMHRHVKRPRRPTAATRLILPLCHSRPRVAIRHPRSIRSSGLLTPYTFLPLLPIKPP